MAMTAVLGCLLARPACAQAPWLRAELLASGDNQPRTMLHVKAEHGRYVHPSITVAGLVSAMSLESHVSGEAGLAGSIALPSIRTGLSGEVRALLGAPAGGTALLYNAKAAVNVGAGVSLRGGIARDRYTSTLASVDTVVLVQTAEVSIGRPGEPGWAGELLARTASFGDDNPVTTAYGWILAPLHRAARASLRAGYAISWQDSPESSWTPDEAGGPPRGPPSPGPTIRGRYAPYYTPHDVLIHNLLANVALAVGAGWLILDGEYGVRATELAPTLERTGAGAAALTFHERSFTPWRVGTSLTMPLDDRSSFTVRVEHLQNAFFRESVARASIVRSLQGED